MQLVKLSFFLCLILAASAKKNSAGKRGKLWKKWEMHSKLFDESCRLQCEDGKSFPLLIKESDDCPKANKLRDMIARMVKPKEICDVQVIFTRRQYIFDLSSQFGFHAGYESLPILCL